MEDDPPPEDTIVVHTHPCLFMFYKILEIVLKKINFLLLRQPKSTLFVIHLLWKKKWNTRFYK